jgi:YVTN family beta-propeller protein
VISPTNQILTTVAVGTSPTGVAVSNTGANDGYVYVTNQGSNTVSVISPTNQILTTINLGGGSGTGNASGVAVAPAGTPNAGDVYVANINSADQGIVNVISPTNQILTTINLNGGPPGAAIGPYGLAVAPAGTPNAGDIYVTLTNPASQNIVNVISPTNQVLTFLDLGQGLPEGVAVSGGGANAGDVYVPNFGSNTVSVISPTNQILTTVTVGNGPTGVAAAPAGAANAGDVYVGNSSDIAVSVIDPANTVYNLVVGSGPSGVAVAPTTTPTAGYVYVTNTSGNNVAVLDPANQILTLINVGTNPEGVAVAG